MGGLETTATLLFSDLRSFTTITESLGAQGTVKLLNEYFEIMVECISEQGGNVRQIYWRCNNGCIWSSNIT